MFCVIPACKRGLAAEEQFSDGVGYSWIDTLKEVAAQQVLITSWKLPASASVQHADIQRSISVPGNV